jgi:hypothetical protein
VVHAIFMEIIVSTFRCFVEKFRSLHCRSPFCLSALFDAAIISPLVLFVSLGKLAKLACPALFIGNLPCQPQFQS